MPGCREHLQMPIMDKHTLSEEVTQGLLSHRQVRRGLGVAAIALLAAQKPNQTHERLV